MRLPIDLSSYGEYLHYGVPLALLTVMGPDGRVNVSTNASITPLPGEIPRLVAGVLTANYTNQLIARSREFVVNVLTETMRSIARECGSYSGQEMDKLALCGLTTHPPRVVKTPLIAECPLNLECKVEDVHHLGDVDLWIARILVMEVAPEWSDGHSGVNLERFQPLLYAFGHTFARGSAVGYGSI